MNKRGITYLHNNHNLRLRQIRELSKLPSIILIRQRKLLKMESDVASFIDVGKLLTLTVKVSNTYFTVFLLLFDSLL